MLKLIAKLKKFFLSFMRFVQKKIGKIHVAILYMILIWILVLMLFYKFVLRFVPIFRVLYFYLGFNTVLISQ